MAYIIVLPLSDKGAKQTGLKRGEVSKIDTIPEHWLELAHEGDIYLLDRTTGTLYINKYEAETGTYDGYYKDEEKRLVDARAFFDEIRNQRLQQYYDPAEFVRGDHVIRKFSQDKEG